MARNNHIKGTGFHLADHKKGITRAFLVILILFLLCFGVFSCSSYFGQKFQVYVDTDNMQLVQLDEPEPDAPAMCVHTTAGDIVAELYPDEAPDYVAQFTKLAESGYYDNTYIFQVEDGVYFEAGTPNEDGTLTAGTDDTYEKVERETSANLWPLRGAFCAPGTSQDGTFWDRLTGNVKNYCGTRFVVCNSIVFDESAKNELESVSENAEKINQAFLENGGVPNYSQQMTVFAQAYGDESFDTIDKITSAAVKASSGDGGYTPPEEDILIQKVEIGTYGAFASDAKTAE